MQPEPIATYRLQLRPGFGFDQAAALVPYLAGLGISHVYSSPCLQAAANSNHGYDVVDPTQVNRDLGGAEVHARYCRALEQAGLGQMLDIVPNHMAIVGRQNPWWWDVLENGPSSRYAIYFDVDWDASPERWPNKVLLPVLADHYGRVLEAGELRLEREESLFALRYQEHVFPVDPSSLPELLARPAAACKSELLKFIVDSYAHLPRPTVTDRRLGEQRYHDKIVLERLLARLLIEEPYIVTAIDAEIARINGDPDALDALIDEQNYRLAFWRTAGRDIGYRRFFDINNLVGLRVEEEDVFLVTHTLPIAWVRDGSLHGLRIDHPDGLRDPAQYFRRLRQSCPEAWIVAEKIIGQTERLPEDWPIDGTTGYDFLNIVGGLFIDPKGKDPLTSLYADFTGEVDDFGTLIYKCKHQVLTELLASDLNRLTALFIDICERHRRHRDYTRHELHEALCDAAACFPVYRTYVRASPAGVSESDVRYVREAVGQAMAKHPDIDHELFHFLENLLLLRVPGSLESELAMRFQQLTAPAMAKGGEDTAFYRFHRLVSLNEVGGEPDRFGTAVADFHRFCLEAQTQRPLSLLATSTHDTKRSEDVRTRLALLSETPERWSQAVSHWARHNERYRVNDIPDPNTEYLFYQVLVGAWPIEIQRMTAYMEKAVCEAKVHTSWTRRNEAYERGVREFVQGVMSDREFCAGLEEFVAFLVAPGRVNSLAQTLIKLTAPGVPDIFQGSEVWDFSLVDPDNRRPVEFAHRASLLAMLAEGITPEEVLARSDQGLPKLWVIYQTLCLRRERPVWFGPKGDYRPLTALGAKADHVVAFRRGEGAVTIVPRLVLGLDGDWGETTIELGQGRWRNVLTGEIMEGSVFRLSEMLARFPVGLLIREE